jgi:hypothetical protein
MSSFLAKNVGTVDRVVRVVGGLGLLSLFVVAPDSPYKWLGVLGAVFVATGLASRCPIYTAIGVSTCPLDTSTGT